MKLLCMMLEWWIQAIIHLYKPINCRTPRANPKVNCGLWVIMICKYRVINFNKCTTLVRDADNGGGCAGMGAGSLQEISVSSSQLCCELKIALKIKCIKNIVESGRIDKFPGTSHKSCNFWNIYINNLYSCSMRKVESLFLLDSSSHERLQ